jgi:adenylosuccinate synthase
MRPWVGDCSLVLHDLMKRGEPVMFEGAQATLLDIDHGTYPYVTSSNASVGGVCTGLGIPPRCIGGVLGVAKAYTTRVGEGPLPTELSGALADRLRETGQEYGASTGRPRRCGWFDAVVVRYSVRVNGLDALALTKLDVLDGLDEVLICTGYRTTQGTISDFPADLRSLVGAEPVYVRVPGWSTPTKGVTEFDRPPCGGAALRAQARGTDRGGVRDHFHRLGPRRNDRQERLAGRKLDERYDAVMVSMKRATMSGAAS